jgi:ParB-like chromosome segregation protein Spo0J
MSAPTAQQHAEPDAASIASSAEIFYIDPAAHLPIHPVAGLMPRMSAEDFEAFVESMLKLGQKEPVSVFNGQLIDGHHRALACKRLNVPIMGVEWDQVGTLEDFVIAKNVQRRQLTQAQRAAIAVAFLPKLKEEALARMTSGKSNHTEALPQGTAADIAGNKLGVSGKSVSAAEKIKAGSEELFQQVLNGTLSIPKAQKLAEKQNVAPAQPERITCSIEEAVAKILQLVPEEEFNFLIGLEFYTPPVISKAIRKRLDGEFTGEPNRFQMILDALTPGLPRASGN